MPEYDPPPAAPPHPDPRLSELQRVLDEEIPLCHHMGVRVEGQDDRGLTLSVPLSLNKNHQGTAFAGSLNALCTITGWGAAYLETLSLGVGSVIVIRRSSIKYHRPVASDRIYARCLTAPAGMRAHFGEMLREKRQAKLDLVVEIQREQGFDRPCVAFHGSYVATAE